MSRLKISMEQRGARGAQLALRVVELVRREARDAVNEQTKEARERARAAWNLELSRLVDQAVRDQEREDAIQILTHGLLALARCGEQLDAEAGFNLFGEEAARYSRAMDDCAYRFQEGRLK